MKKIIFFYATLFISLANLYADFGLVASEGIAVEHYDKTAFSSKTTLSPWLSFPIGGANFYISLGFIADYEKEFALFPELHKMELSLRLPVDYPGTTSGGTNYRFGFRLGRIFWQEPSQLLAAGFFDGLDVFAEFGSARLGATAFYTGFLYKNTANINISPGDPIDYGAVLDWDNFKDTYFAPRRLITSLYGDFPGFPFGRGEIHAGLLAQFDFSGAEEAYNTQYLLFRYLFFYKRFDLAASGAAELENTEANGLKAGYAFSVEGGWQLGLLIDRLSLGFRMGSGERNNSAAFFPLVREAQGLVLEPILSGMMIIRLLYEARPISTLSMELGGRYFIRTDGSNFTDPHLENDSYFLGAEVNGAMLWVPVSDLSFSLSGGVFLPKTGRAFTSGTPVRWAINLGTIFSF